MKATRELLNSGLSVRHFSRLISCILLITLFSFLLSPAMVSAQDNEPTPTAEPPGQDPVEPDVPLVHIVQEGETLFSIAQLYETTVEVLEQLNEISDPSLVYVGQELVIPGGGGDVVATIHTVQVGDTLQDLATAYNTTWEALADQNRLIYPGYLAAGQELSILSRTGTTGAQPSTGTAHVVRPGDTLLTIAAEYNLSPAEIVSENELSFPTYLYQGQRLRLPGQSKYQSLPGYWRQVRLYPAPVTQGDTVAIYVESTLAGVPEGNFAGRALHFQANQDGYIAMVGLDAFMEPGLYPLELVGSGDRPWPPFEQDVRLLSAGYGVQYVTVPEELSYLLAPEVRAEDEALMAPFFSQLSERQWEGPFQYPVNNAPITAGYGDARSYNEGPIEIFHTGIDFSGPIGTPIHAPAVGTVVFSDTLALHGNTLIVDHGLGVMSAYYHLSKVHVSLNEQLDTGQIIAEGGSTGLSSGPHLHWDVRVGNVPVDGRQWTEEDLFSQVILAVSAKAEEKEEGS